MELVMRNSDRGTLILFEWAHPETGEEYLVEAGRMIYKWRLYFTPKANPNTWDYAWCYGNGHTMLLAAAEWNPTTEDEPLDWQKRATYERVRQAPQRPPGAPIRCIHGRWAADMDCDVIPCPHWRPATLPAVDLR